ncbi:MAG: hypothetical protein AAGJ94_05190 [Pseudomonadota bacterium]
MVGEDEGNPGLGDGGGDTVKADEENGLLFGNDGNETPTGSQYNNSRDRGQSNDSRDGGLGNLQLFGNWHNETPNGGDGINPLIGRKRGDFFIITAQPRNPVTLTARKFTKLP